MQDNITIIRDGNAKLEELRSMLNSLNKDELIEKKEKIKQLAREHRDDGSLGNEELDENIAEVEALNSQIEELKVKEEEIKKQIQEIEEKIKAAQEDAEKENVENNEERGDLLNMENRDVLSSMEYRSAFKDYVQKGVKNDILQVRTDANTTTTTAATVIPTQIMEEIIKESKVSGNVLSKVRKMNVKGGVKIPTISAIPTASWIDEDDGGERKNLTTGSVTFSYYGLEVKIAQSLLSEYVSIDAFEKEFASLAVEAMTNAKEIAIFNGTGSGQPTGILKTTGIVSHSIKAADFVKYDKLVEAAGKLSVGYRAGAEWYMASGTWDSVVGMVDTAGQPIARVNYGLDGIARSLLGYPVNLVESDRLKDLATATAGTEYFAVLGNMNKYAINSNGNLGVYKYRDEDKNQDVTKALEFCDGKVLDPKAFLCLKKATA